MAALMTHFLRYMPLTLAGRAFWMTAMKCSRLATSLSSPKLILPMTQCTLPPSSLRYSCLPAAYSRTASATLGVTVPALGLGMRPLGPSTLPSLLTTRIMSGLATATSNSIHPPSMRATSSSPPASTAPAALAAAALSLWQKQTTRALRPMPCGMAIEPRRA